jgi:atypical dual specificity phosphatase
MLLEFYGQECPHCLKMAPLIERLATEASIEIEKYEVWHSEENIKKMQEHDTGMCGGVPFFVNTETKSFICGETSYEELKKWAAGEKTMSPHSKAQKEIDYSNIIDGIYIGTNQCCQTHFDEELKNAGIDADISLEESRVDAPFGVSFYLWLPTKDQSAPTVEQLEFGVSAIENLVAKKTMIYVHCKNGHGRAPTLVAAYLIKKGKTLDEAIDFIKSKRPAVHLQEVQMEALKTFASKIGK